MKSTELVKNFGYVEVEFDSCSNNTLCYNGQINGDHLSIFAHISDMNNFPFSAIETIDSIVEMVGGIDYIIDINFYLMGKLLRD